MCECKIKLTKELDTDVSNLLHCRGFVWDVLLSGEWSGCSKGKLKELVSIHGAKKVGEAFDA